MRPLYMYYQNLRKAITKGPKAKSQGGSRASSIGADSNAGSIDPAIGFGGSAKGSPAGPDKGPPKISDLTEEEEKKLDPAEVLK